MAFKTVTDKLPEIIKLGPDNPQYCGYYLQIRETKNGKLIDVCQEEGEVFSISGNTDILRKLISVPPGSLIQVSYTGTKTVGSGQTMKLFEVQYDVTKRYCDYAR